MERKLHTPIVLCFGEQDGSTCIARYKVTTARAPLTYLVSVTAEDLSDCVLASLQINILC